MTYGLDPYAFDAYGGAQQVPVYPQPASMTMRDRPSASLALSARAAFTLVMGDRA
jgi:hypothetical protein